MLAIQLCKRVFSHGLDIAGLYPGHYFDDVHEGIVSNMRSLEQRDPWRKRLAPSTVRRDVGNVADTRRDVMLRYMQNTAKGNHDLTSERRILKEQVQFGRLLTMTPYG